nr:MAG TPA: hypothetical protein [Caudoviricetes sp.]
MLNERIILREIHPQVLFHFFQSYNHVYHHLNPGKGAVPLVSEAPPLVFYLGSSVCLQLQNLYGFGEDEFAVHALLGHIANHAVACEQFHKLLEGTGTTVTDVVILVVTEGDGILRRIRRGVHRISKQTVRLTRLCGRLPDVGTVVVLQLTDGRDVLIVDDKCRRLTVRTLQGIHKVDDIVSLDSCGKGLRDLATAIFRKQAERLAHAITVKEGILLGIGQCLTELGDDVVLKAEGIVIEQFLGDLDCHMKLVGIQKNLREGSVTKGQCASLLNPGCRRFGGCDVDFMLTGSGNLCGELTHDVLLVEYINQTVIVLLRYQITAIGIHAFLQYIGYLLEVGAERLEHTLTVLIRGTSGLGLFIAVSLHRLCHNGSVHRLIEGVLHFLHCLHTVDFSADILDLLLHSSIGLGILLGEQAVLVTLGFHEGLCSLPCLVALLTHFQNSHNPLPPVFDKIEPFHKGIGCGFFCGFFCFRCDFALGCQLLHKGVGHSRTGKHHADRWDFHLIGDGSLHDFIGEPILNGAVCIHPGLRIHEVGQLGAGKSGLDFVGIDDGFLNLVQHSNGLLHFCGIATSHCHGVVNHQHRYRGNQHLGACHGNDTGR